jgi:hypothetical protein
MIDVWDDKCKMNLSDRENEGNLFQSNSIEPIVALI